MTDLQPLPAFAGILKQQETFGTGRTDDLGDRLNTEFDKVLLQSGWDVSPGVLMMLTALAGLLAGGLVLVIQENFLTAALSFGIAALAPIGAVYAARARRQKKMMDQLPEAVDELARAARTGRSLEQCFRVVATDTPSPLGDEFRLCAQKLDLGLALRDAIKDLPTRTGLVSLNILVMALSVHMVTGGDLVHVLDRLAHTLRARIQYLGRLAAATAASRATAILMIVLPPMILLFFMLRDANYFQELMSTPYGRGMTLVAVGLDIIGILWVLRILRTSQQT